MIAEGVCPSLVRMCLRDMLGAQFRVVRPDAIPNVLRSNRKVTKPLKLSQMIDINGIDVLVLEGLVQRPIGSEYQTLVRCDVDYTRIG